MIALVGWNNHSIYITNTLHYILMVLKYNWSDEFQLIADSVRVSKPDVHKI